MEIKEENITIDEFKKLMETGKQIIINSTRDLLIWDAVVKQCEQILSKRESIEADEVLKEIAQG